jgi:hypothetical protein
VHAFVHALRPCLQLFEPTTEQYQAVTRSRVALIGYIASYHRRVCTWESLRCPSGPPKAGFQPTFPSITLTGKTVDYQLEVAAALSELGARGVPARIRVRGGHDCLKATCRRVQRNVAARQGTSASVFYNIHHALV